MIQHDGCPKRYTDLVPTREFLMGLRSLFKSYFQAVSVNGDERSVAGKESANDLLRKAKEADRFTISFDRFSA